jgi:hypothetical protein
MIKGAQLGRNRKGKAVLQRVSMKYGVGTERGAGVKGWEGGGVFLMWGSQALVEPERSL